MLVLGRREGERIMIGDDIVISVLGVDGERVKIGIEAPARWRVLRHELYEEVKAENRRAAEQAAVHSRSLASLQKFFVTGRQGDSAEA